MTDCIPTAEDVVHDTFVEFLRHPHLYDAARGTLRAYLYGIARHHLAKALRVKGRYVNDEPWNEEPEANPAPPMQLDQADSTLEEQIDKATARERIRAAILALPPLYREVVALCDMEDLPYALVAEIIGCPVGTVRSRLHRARALLAAGLAAMTMDTHSAPNPGSGQGGTRQACATVPLTLAAKGTTT